MIKQIMGWLLNQANRYEKNEYYYAVKNKVIKQFGTYVCTDVQHIEGKECYTCGGSGVYVGYNYHGHQFTDGCYHCYNGWYKRPMWVLLEKYQVGNYYFHQPKQKVYENPQIPVNINGYISHDTSKYGAYAAFLLYMIYEKGYLKRWYKSAGMGWYIKWYYPKNLPHTIVHFIKYKQKAYPIVEFMEWLNKPSGYVRDVVYDYEFFVGRKSAMHTDDLPF